MRDNVYVPRAAMLLYRWSVYEQYQTQLDPGDLADARMLFGALAKLSPEEIQLLAVKYKGGKFGPVSSYTGYPNRMIPLLDIELAEQYGLTLRTYQGKRRAIEAKLHRLMVKAELARRHAKGEDLDRFTLRLGDLYVHHATDFPHHEILLTDYQRSAQVFDRTTGDPLASEYGLKKVAPWQDIH